MPEADAPAPCNAVAIKLPVFWPANPRVWFGQAEAQFAIRNITTANTKYSHVVAALDQDSASRIVDFLDNPPAAGDRYEAIKDRLLDTFTLSEHARAGLLLSHPGLGSDLPTALMDKMLALMHGHSPCFLFRRLFIDLMPEDLRPILAQDDTTDLRELAKKADRLYMARPDQVHAMSTSRQQRLKKPKPGEPCWYHATYGSKARQCVAPCAFSSARVAGVGEAPAGNAGAGSQ